MTVLRIVLIGSALVLAGCDAGRGSDPPILALEPERTWSFGPSDAPYRAAALADDKIAFVTEDRRRVILIAGEDQQLVASFPEGGIGSIAAEPHLIWVGVGHQLFSIDPATQDLRVERAFRVGDTILSIAVSSGRVWVGVDQRGAFRLVSLRPDAGGGMEVVSERVLGTSRISISPWSDGSALVQEIGYPFHGFEVAEDLTELWSFKPAGAMLQAAIKADSRGDWWVGATIRLGEELFLQWFNNARSLERLAILLRIPGGAEIRAIGIESPLGLIQAVPGDSEHLLGAFEVPNGRQLVIFRAVWSPS